MEKNDLKLMSQQLPELRDRQIEAALSLLEEGNTIPFIARYRKEATGSLDEVQLQGIQEQWHRVKNLRDRQQTVIKAAPRHRLPVNRACSRLPTGSLWLKEMI